MLKTDTINELIGIDDSWKAPEKLLSIMLDKSKRTELFKSLEDKHMRTLEGYSEQEQKELEDAKKFMNCNYLINNITSYRSNTECGFVKDKYDEAETDEQISIIRDILDFYTDRAKFPEQKYYVQLIRNNGGGYLNRNRVSNSCMTNSCQPYETFQTEFTEQEIKAIDPRYMEFAVPVEADK